MEKVAAQKYIRKVIISWLLAAICLILVFETLNSIKIVKSLPSNLILSQNDLESINLKNITYSVDDNNSKSEKKSIVFKLFNLIPIKTIEADIEQKRNAYLGGFPIGLSIKAGGVIVVKKVEIDTYAGQVFADGGVCEGDIITQINSRPVLYVSDILKEMESYDKSSKMVEVKVLRNGAEKKVACYPVIENLTGYYKLGLAVKDSVDGVGTVSFVKANGRFGCLGHAISGGISGGGVIPCYEGSVYKCKILGYNKGNRGTPGELKGAFYDINKPIGTVDLNTIFGVYGNIDCVADSDLYEIGSRFQVKNGKAKIRTTINDSPAFYDVEIIKASNQNSPCEKGMILRVTDKELLSKTGGILQGMSGSPIIQDGKIIGVVTHVLVSDPTKGYAVYLDWMYDN